jgi:hypothetical protein
MALAYINELALEQYELFETLITSEFNGGRPRTVNLMLVL